MGVVLAVSVSFVFAMQSQPSRSLKVRIIENLLVWWATEKNSKMRAPPKEKDQQPAVLTGVGRSWPLNHCLFAFPSSQEQGRSFHLPARNHRFFSGDCRVEQADPGAP